jgi:hypothetical protein
MGSVRGPSAPPDRREGTGRKRGRFTPDGIVGILGAEQAGVGAADVCRKPAMPASAVAGDPPETGG